MCVCVCACVRACVRACVCVCAFVCASVYVCAYVCVCMCMHIYISIYQCNNNVCIHKNGTAVICAIALLLVYFLFFNCTVFFGDLASWRNTYWRNICH